MTKQWEQYEAIIRALYADHTLSTVRQIMIDQHGFSASVRAYRGRLDRWNVRKYNRRNRKGSLSSSGSGGSGSGGGRSADEASGTSAAPSPNVQQAAGPASLATSHDSRRGGWDPSDVAQHHYHQHRQHDVSATSSGPLGQPYPYSPAQYDAQRRDSQKYNTAGKAQPSPPPPQPPPPPPPSVLLQSAGYAQDAYYWNQHHQHPQPAPLKSQDATTSTTTTVTMLPYYATSYAPIAQQQPPMDTWHPDDGSSIYAPGPHAASNSGFGFGSLHPHHQHHHLHHDQRIHGSSHHHHHHPGLSFGSAGAPQHPPGSMPRAPDAGAGDEGMQGYEVVSPESSQRGVHPH